MFDFLRFDICITSSLNFPEQQIKIPYHLITKLWVMSTLLTAKTPYSNNFTTFVVAKILNIKEFYLLAVI